MTTSHIYIRGEIDGGIFIFLIPLFLLISTSIYSIVTRGSCETELNRYSIEKNITIDNCKESKHPWGCNQLDSCIEDTFSYDHFPYVRLLIAATLLWLVVDIYKVKRKKTVTGADLYKKSIAEESSEEFMNESFRSEILPEHVDLSVDYKDIVLDVMAKHFKYAKFLHPQIKNKRHVHTEIIKFMQSFTGQSVKSIISKMGEISPEFSNFRFNPKLFEKDMPRESFVINYNDTIEKAMVKIYEGACVIYSEFDEPNNARYKAVDEIALFTGKTLASIRSRLGKLHVYQLRNSNYCISLYSFRSYLNKGIKNGVRKDTLVRYLNKKKKELGLYNNAALVESFCEVLDEYNKLDMAPTVEFENIKKIYSYLDFSSSRKSNKLALNIFKIHYLKENDLPEYINFTLPGVSFKKTENVVYFFSDVVYSNTKVIRFKNFKSMSKYKNNIGELIIGELIVTTKHLYFISGSKNFKIPYRNIMRYEDNIDSIEIFIDDINAKQIFFYIDDQKFGNKLISDFISHISARR